MLLFILLIAAVSTTFTGNAEAAPCCSGSSAIPAMITGDDRAQLSASISHATVIGDAFDSGLPRFRGGDESETTSMLRLDGATLLSDRWQMGAGISMLDRGMQNAGIKGGSTHTGDLDLNTAFEAIPEWTYSAWRPRGHVFLSATIPTGRSIYQANEPGLIDSTGKGFFRLAIGTVLTKRWNIWDANFVAEAHRSLPRTFDPTTSTPYTQRIDARWGGSFAIGGGFSPGGGNLRLGLRIQPSFGSPKVIEALGETRHSGRTQTIDTALESSYLVSEANGGTWTAFASYSDQTLLGPAANSTLSRTFALGVQHRWDR